MLKGKVLDLLFNHKLILFYDATGTNFHRLFAAPGVLVCTTLAPFAVLELSTDIHLQQDCANQV